MAKKSKTRAKKELRIGVIGAGGRGGLAHSAHHPEKGVRLVAGADTSPAALSGSSRSSARTSS